MHRRLVLAACLCFAVACGGGDTNPIPATNKSYDIYTLGSAFSPSSLTISPNDTIRFHFAIGAEGKGHDVTFDKTAGAPANIPVTDSGVVARVFTVRGSFHYNCYVHPGMTGDVIVQ